MFLYAKHLFNKVLLGAKLDTPLSGIKLVYLNTNIKLFHCNKAVVLT